ncbi:MAG: hypothetical protein V3T12_10495 [Acidiferrobacterales bacterium]
MSHMGHATLMVPLSPALPTRHTAGAVVVAVAGAAGVVVAQAASAHSPMVRTANP